MLNIVRIAMSRTWKRFLLSLGATTVSIGLTFGIAAIIDHNRSKKEKRDIVMMVMYDMYNSLKAVEDADAKIHQLMEAQLQIAEDTSQIREETIIMMVVNLPTIEYTETIERIFSSNIETINTVGNVFFTEKVAEFYDDRQSYKKNVSDSVYNKILGGNALSTVEDILEANFYLNAVMSNSLMWEMRRLYKLCQQMMNVTDEEIDAYIDRRGVVEADMMDIQESKLATMQELNKLVLKINTAKEKLK